MTCLMADTNGLHDAALFTVETREEMVEKGAGRRCATLRLIQMSALYGN